MPCQLTLRHVFGYIPVLGFSYAMPEVNSSWPWFHYSTVLGWEICHARGNSITIMTSVRYQYVLGFIICLARGNSIMTQISLKYLVRNYALSIEIQSCPWLLPVLGYIICLARGNSMVTLISIPYLVRKYALSMDAKSCPGCIPVLGYIWPWFHYSTWVGNMPC